MASLQLVNHVVAEADLDRSRITDLDIITTGGTPLLFSTTRFDGVLSGWSIDGALTAVSELAFEGGDLPGGTASIMVLDIGADTGFLTGGGSGGLLQTGTVGTNGIFGLPNILPPGMAGFQYGEAVQLADGTQAMYGALAGTAGITRIDFDTAGHFLDSSLIANDPGTAVTDITAIATTVIAGQSFVLTASGADNLVTTWAVDTNGALIARDTMGIDDGLWINAPTSMGVATVGGVNYVVLGAAGSGTLSVMEIGSDGSMILRDHLLDDLTTRFGGVTSIEIVTHDGMTYVIAGGADDGITVFALLEGGHLVKRATIADSTEMGLDNVSAIAARGTGDGLDIYIASSSEAGLTQLRFDKGPTGVTATATLAGGLLAGTAGDDILQGHDGADVITAGAGDDIIRDGAGSDMMTGSDGADLFLLSADGATDTITDFTLGEDQIDLSLWGFLRDISQLTISTRSDGMEIRYGEELLVVQSADGEMIDYRLLTNEDVLGGARIPDQVAPGYAGPATPTPDLTPDQPDIPQVDHGDHFDIRDGLAVIADSNAADLRSALGQGGTPGDMGQPGGSGTHVMIGTNSGQTMTGGDGADMMLGRGWHDILSGGDGADILLGGGGNDRLSGDNGHDSLNGGAGADRLDGGAGDDVLSGGAGADMFVFNGGHDRIADFEQGVDHITLDAALWTGLTSAADVLAIYGSHDDDRVTIDLADGNILDIDGIADYANFAQSITLL